MEYVRTQPLPSPLGKVIFRSNFVRLKPRNKEIFLLSRRFVQAESRSLRRVAPWFCLLTTFDPQNFDFAQDDTLDFCCAVIFIPIYPHEVNSNIFPSPQEKDSVV